MAAVREGPVDDETEVFAIGDDVAVPLMGGCRLPAGTRVRQRRLGAAIVIEPVADRRSDAFLALPGAWRQPLERPGGDEPIHDPFW